MCMGLLGVFQYYFKNFCHFVGKLKSSRGPFFLLKCLDHCPVLSWAVRMLLYISDKLFSLHCKLTCSFEEGKFDGRMPYVLIYRVHKLLWSMLAVNQFVAQL
jgi:hypothetical protein